MEYTFIHTSVVMYYICIYINKYTTLVLMSSVYTYIIYPPVWVYTQEGTQDLGGTQGGTLVRDTHGVPKGVSRGVPWQGVLVGDTQDLAGYPGGYPGSTCRK